MSVQLHMRPFLSMAIVSTELFGLNVTVRIFHSVGTPSTIRQKLPCTERIPVCSMDSSLFANRLADWLPLKIS